MTLRISGAKARNGGKLLPARSQAATAPAILCPKPPVSGSAYSAALKALSANGTHATELVVNAQQMRTSRRKVTCRHAGGVQSPRPGKARGRRDSHGDASLGVYGRWRGLL